MGVSAPTRRRPMRLLMIRHAIALPRGPPDIPDDERPLTKRGAKRFRAAAEGLARIVARPDVLFTSPLPRARQTAEIAAQAWGKVEPVDLPALAEDPLDRAVAELNKHTQ